MHQTSQSRHTPNRAYLVLMLSLLGMAFSGIFVSLAGAPGAVSAFYRMSIATLVLVFPFMRGIQREGRPTRHEALIAILAGLFFAGDLFFWNTGILISGATTPTLMGNTAPPYNAGDWGCVDTTTAGVMFTGKPKRPPIDLRFPYSLPIAR